MSDEKKNHGVVDKWLTEDSLFLLSCWSRDGFTFGEMAERMGITQKTLSVWRSKYPEIKQATEANRELVDYQVENALYKRAVGFTYKEVKTIITPRADGSQMTARIETVEKEVLPDVTACLSWLNNRCPDKWKRNRDNFANPNNDDNKVTINIVRRGDRGDQVKATVKSQDEEWENEWNSWEEDDDE